MINEERVKQLYKVALCEKKEEKAHRQIGRYYKNDYIGKELLKSIFTGTAAYFFMSVLYLIYRWAEIMKRVNQINWGKVWMPAVLFYVLFMVVYMLATYYIYKARYEEYYKQMSAYEEELEALDKIYEREEKLKQ